MSPLPDSESGREIFTTRRLHADRDTREECERVKRFAVTANEENLDRLEAELATMA